MARIAHAINSVETPVCLVFAGEPVRVLRMLLIALKQRGHAATLKLLARIAHAINSVETCRALTHVRAAGRVLRMLLIALKPAVSGVSPLYQRVLRMLLIALKQTGSCIGTPRKGAYCACY